MKLLKLFLILSATALIMAAAPLQEDNNKHSNKKTQEAAPSNLRGASRFLVQQNLILSNLTCSNFPRICRLKGSPGPDCCKKKCVNVKKDRLNCGMCGYKCKYTEICCKGQCVNSSFDKRNCGGCNKKCRRGESCVYGMCNYA